MTKESCLNCEQPFDQKVDWQMFCSDKCKKIYWYSDRHIQCPKCNHIFRMSANAFKSPKDYYFWRRDNAKEIQRKKS